MCIWVAVELRASIERAQALQSRSSGVCFSEATNWVALGLRNAGGRRIQLPWKGRGAGSRPKCAAHHTRDDDVLIDHPDLSAVTSRLKEAIKRADSVQGVVVECGASTVILKVEYIAGERCRGTCAACGMHATLKLTSGL